MNLIHQPNEEPIEGLSASMAAALEGLQLTPAVLDAYLRLLASDTDAGRPADLRQEEIRALAEFGLVVQSASDDVVAIDPRLGLTRLAERQDAELRQRLAQTALAREAASELALHVEQRRRRDAPGIETIEGGASIAARVMELMRNTQAEALSMLTWQPTRESIRSAAQEDQMLLDRGVSVRLLVLQAHVRGSADYTSHLHDISARGAEVRVATTLPTRQVILDREIAVVPADHESPRHAASIVHHRTLVQLGFDAFESYWQNAAPLTRRTVNSEWEPDALTLKVLDLLAQGGKDEAISRRVGMSLRSVRRLISRVSDEVSAQSRFELAILCTRRGWISPARPGGADLSEVGASSSGHRRSP